MRTERALFGSATLLVALALLAPAPAAAFCRMTTSRMRPTAAMPCVTEGIPLAWQRRCHSVMLTTSASGDLSEDEVRQIVRRSFEPWTQIQCGGQPVGFEFQLEGELSTCGVPTYQSGGRNANTINFVDTQGWIDRDYEPDAFAVTIVFHNTDTGEILDVDMEINEGRGPYGICPDAGCTDMRTVDLQNVLTHEFGHFLGLAHSFDDPNATMWPSADIGETIKRSLHPDDIAGICAAYPPGSLPDTCDFAPRGGLATDCDEGCSVSRVGGRFTRNGGAGLMMLMIAMAAAFWRRRRR